MLFIHFCYTKNMIFDNNYNKNNDNIKNKMSIKKFEAKNNQKIDNLKCFEQLTKVVNK